MRTWSTPLWHRDSIIKGNDPWQLPRCVCVKHSLHTHKLFICTSTNLIYLFAQAHTHTQHTNSIYAHTHIHCRQMPSVTKLASLLGSKFGSLIARKNQRWGGTWQHRVQWLYLEATLQASAAARTITGGSVEVEQVFTNITICWSETPRSLQQH